MVAASVFRCTLVLAFLHAHAAVGLVRIDAERIGTSLQDQFARFTKKYERTYQQGTEEYERRSGVFADSIERIGKLNARPGKTWIAGINVLADYTHDERQKLLGWRGGATKKNNGVEAHSPVALSRVWRDWKQPKAHDWNKLFNMNHIRDQGVCGSCWAVATTTVLAAHSEIYRDNRTFSTQELVDCVPNPHKCGGEGGCKGATVELAMQYVATRGLATPSENPYKGTSSTFSAVKSAFGQKGPAPAPKRDSCTHRLEDHEIRLISAISDEAAVHQAGPKGQEFGMFGWQKLPENRYEPLVHALVNRGPVAVSIAAGGNLMLYDSGVFHPDDCDWVLNHAVTLIGFGTDVTSGFDFWQIQNSWGADWGENGKMRLMRHMNEETYCGKDDQPELGVGCDGGPTSVTVCGTCGILYDSVVPLFTKTPA